MENAEPILFSEHVREYADSRGVALEEIAAAIRTERWHPRGRVRYECRKSFAYAGRWCDTKQVRVVFDVELGRIVVVTAYRYLVRTRARDNGTVAA